MTPESEIHSRWEYHSEKGLTQGNPHHHCMTLTQQITRLHRTAMRTLHDPLGAARLVHGLRFEADDA